MRQQLLFQQIFRRLLVGNEDIHLRLKNRNQSGIGNTAANFKLLVHDFFNSVRIGRFDNRPHFRSENMPFLRPFQQFLQIVDRLHHPDAVFLFRKSLVHLQDRQNPFLFPQVICGKLPVNLPFHRVLKKNCPQNMLGSESWACHNPGPHLMDKVEHLLIAVIGFIRNTIEPESLRRAPAALIQCRDKTVSLVHPFKLFLIHICSPFSAEFRQISRSGLYDQPSAYIQPMRPSPQLLIKINKFLYSYIILPYPQKRHKISANSTKKSGRFARKPIHFPLFMAG